MTTALNSLNTTVPLAGVVLGAVDGVVLGAVDGVVLGAVEGVVLGAVEGVVLGAVEGVVLGRVDGAMLGAAAANAGAATLTGGGLFVATVPLVVQLESAKTVNAKSE